MLLVSPTKPRRSSGTNYITNGLLGWWKFDEGSGTTVADSSGNGNTGTLTNTTWTSTSKQGPFAGSFNGSSSSVDIGVFDSLSGLTSLSACAWIFPTIIDSAEHAILRKQTNKWNMIISSSNTLRWEDSGGQKFSSSALSANSWYHVCFTTSGGSWVWYINGAQDNTGSNTTTIGSDTGSDCYIGSNSGIQFFFGGTIDDVRVYNRQLSSTEVSSIFNLTG